MLKDETEMKLLVWNFYQFPPPPLPRYHTLDTQLGERACCEKKDSKAFLLYPCPVFPPPPPLSPQESFYFKKKVRPAMVKKPSEQGR